MKVVVIMNKSHFSSTEFMCPCGCGRADVQPELIAALEELRAKVGKPIHITSGFRCPFHNADVGGARNSQHILGRAADITVKGMFGRELYEIARTVQAFKGFGQGKNYLHVDIRTTLPAKWMYDDQGNQVTWA